MSKLNVDQKTIKDLFQSKKSDFLIPDYQRPYAWGEAECRTLWDDIFSFAIPDEGKTEFDSNSEYFLGPIVTFRNEDKLEVIDGQQRLTTLMLLLRAFYSKFGHMQDKASISTKQNIEKCLWKTDEFGEPDMSQLKIDSEVATDNDKEEFLEILRTGIVNKEMKSKYACNFRFFQNNIDEFLSKYPTYFAYLPTRIMNNCILLPIEAESQDTALRIFSTLNDRGKPLSDADIFKAQFYKHFSKLGKKEEFIAQWKKLEELCERIFHPISGTPMDELFTRYMYFVRAKMGIVSSTTEALRKFYEKNSYALLKDTNTLTELIVLAEFWEDVSNQDTERFSNRVLKRFFVLNYAPNGMWTYFVSVYFMQNKDDEGLDYILSASSGALCGIIDVFLVGKPGESPLGDITDKWFANRTIDFAKICGYTGDKNSLSSAIKFLEKKFKIPYDQSVGGGIFRELIDLTPSNHHFKSLGHNPTLLGLFFSILNQFTNTSDFVSNGELISLNNSDGKFELQGKNIPSKLFCGIANWIGHLISDVSGSSSSKGRGK